MEQDDYSLNELIGATDVSARTVRYYIAEGLLPPPVAAGPRSSYSKSHLNRLLLIGRLKRSYFPLREIRRQLDGMSDAEIEAMLHHPLEFDQFPAKAGDDELNEDHSTSFSQAPGQSPIRRLQQRPPVSRFASKPLPHSPGSEDTPETQGNFPMPLHPASHLKPADTNSDGIAWRRIDLGPDAELLIREDAFHRKRDRVEWLINWAKRVFN